MRISARTLIAFLAVLGFSSGANAVVTLSFEWIATDGSGTTGATSITAAAGDKLTLGVFLDDGTDALTAYQFKIQFDTDTVDELNFSPLAPLAPLAAWTAIVPAGLIGGALPSGTESGAGAGLVGAGATSINAIGLPPGVSVGPPRVQVGSLAFTVTANVATDGADVTFIPVAFGNGAGGVITSIVSGSAAVDVIPEPGTFAILSLGLLGLGVAGRRR